MSTTSSPDTYETICQKQIIDPLMEALTSYPNDNLKIFYTLDKALRNAANDFRCALNLDNAPASKVYPTSGGVAIDNIVCILQKMAQTATAITPYKRYTVDSHWSFCEGKTSGDVEHTVFRARNDAELILVLRKYVMENPGVDGMFDIISDMGPSICDRMSPEITLTESIEKEIHNMRNGAAVYYDAVIGISEMVDDPLIFTLYVHSDTVKCIKDNGVMHVTVYNTKTFQLNESDSELSQELATELKQKHHWSDSALWQFEKWVLAKNPINEMRLNIRTGNIAFIL